MATHRSDNDEEDIEYPSSYFNNTEKEEITLAFVENVRQQFQMIFPKRAELFLSPFNECGIRVFFLIRFIFFLYSFTPPSFRNLFQQQFAQQFFLSPNSMNWKAVPNL